MRDDSASAYVLCPLDPFFVLIYEGSSKGQNKEEYKEWSAGYLTVDEVENDNDLLSYC